MKIDTNDHPVQCSTFQYYFYAIIVSINFFNLAFVFIFSVFILILV